MAEWLYERGIGEERAALVADGAILEALIERDDQAPRAGSVLSARLVRTLIPKRRGIVALDHGEALIEPIPPGISEGAALNVEITREAIPEAGRPRLPKAVASDRPPAPAPALKDRLAASGVPVRDLLAHQPDALEAAGWSDLIEEALTGEISFPGGSLRMSITPAMTLFDIDGALPLRDLALAGAEVAGKAIRRMGIGGSIGIDFPTIAGKAERQAVAAALDAVLPPPFERTAINGFGFLQIVRPRLRPSLPELLAADPVRTAALALLRRAERTPGAGPITLHAASEVIALIASQAGWHAELERRTGALLRLCAEPSRPISSGDVQRAPL